MTFKSLRNKTNEASLQLHTLAPGALMLRAKGVGLLLLKCVIFKLSTSRQRLYRIPEATLLHVLLTASLTSAS